MRLAATCAAGHTAVDPPGNARCGSPMSPRISGTGDHAIPSGIRRGRSSADFLVRSASASVPFPYGLRSGDDERYAWRSAGSVDARAVIDSQDNDGVLIVVDLVDHSVRPRRRRAEPREFALQTPADAVWVLDEGAQHELHDRLLRCPL